MQAIPSTTPLSRTAFCTSSVMSLTVRPPAVRRRVSCWKTFIVVAILRESLPGATAEVPHSQWILREPRPLQLRRPTAVTDWSVEKQRVCRAFPRDITQPLLRHTLIGLCESFSGGRLL